MANIHRSSLLKNLSQQLNNSTYSDLTIRCGERSFYVHKAIVCPASRVLRAALKHPTTEALTNTIDHNEFNAATVESFLTYLYTEDYHVKGDPSVVEEKDDENAESMVWDGSDDEENDATSGTQGLVVSQGNKRSDRGSGQPQEEISLFTNPSLVIERLVAHARVYAIGNYYDVSQMRVLATGKFLEAGKAEWLTSTLGGLVVEVYSLTTQTDCELREALVSTAMNRVQELREDETFINFLRWEPVAQEFAVELFLRTTGLHNASINDISEEALLRHNAEEAVRRAQSDLNEKHLYVKRLKTVLQKHQLNCHQAPNNCMRCRSN